jgi:hypothetical protein
MDIDLKDNTGFPTGLSLFLRLTNMIRGLALCQPLMIENIPAPYTNPKIYSFCGI